MEEIEIEVTPSDCPFVKDNDPCDDCDFDCVCKIWIRQELITWK